jgi:hypothetical protein
MNSHTHTLTHSHTDDTYVNLFKPVIKQVSAYACVCVCTVCMCVWNMYAASILHMYINVFTHTYACVHTFPLHCR